MVLKGWSIKNITNKSSWQGAIATEAQSEQKNHLKFAALVSELYRCRLVL